MLRLFFLNSPTINAFSSGAGSDFKLTVISPPTVKATISNNSVKAKVNNCDN